MGAKGKKRGATLSRGAPLHEGTRLIKGLQIANKDMCVFLFCLFVFCCCLKSSFDQEEVC